MSNLLEQIETLDGLVFVYPDLDIISVRFGEPLTIWLRDLASMAAASRVLDCDIPAPKMRSDRVGIRIIEGDWAGQSVEFRLVVLIPEPASAVTS